MQTRSRRREPRTRPAIYNIVKVASLPTVNTNDAKHFRRADAVTLTLSRDDVDAIRRALDRCAEQSTDAEDNAPATLRRRFVVN